MNSDSMLISTEPLYTIFSRMPDGRDLCIILLQQSHIDALAGETRSWRFETDTGIKFAILRDSALTQSFLNEGRKVLLVNDASIENLYNGVVVFDLGIGVVYMSSIETAIRDKVIEESPLS